MDKIKIEDVSCVVFIHIHIYFGNANIKFAVADVEQNRFLLSTFVVVISDVLGVCICMYINAGRCFIQLQRKQVQKQYF